MLPTTFNIVTNVVEGYDPQPIYVEQENLSVKKVINKFSPVARSSRMNYCHDLADVGESPEGQVVFEFRSRDILKPLYAHFQNGDVIGTNSPYRYTFYPITGQLRNYTQGAYTIGSYGVNSQRAYTLAVAKQVSVESFYLFSGGIVDKLQFSFASDNTAKASCNFVFTDYDLTQAYMDVPSGTFAGTYATEEGYSFEDIHVTIAGTNFPIDALTFGGDHGVQVSKTVGAKNPKRYLLGNYSVQGNFSFDLPTNALKLVGSMIDLGTFSIEGTLTHGTADRVSFSMPKCVRAAFDYSLAPDLANKGAIPFNAYGDATTPPLTVTVDTTYVFSPMTGNTAIEDTMGATDTITNTMTAEDTITDG